MQNKIKVATPPFHDIFGGKLKELDARRFGYRCPIIYPLKRDLPPANVTVGGGGGAVWGYIEGAEHIDGIINRKEQRKCVSVGVFGVQGTRIQKGAD